MSHFYTCKDCIKANEVAFDTYECRRRAPTAGGQRPFPQAHMDQRPIWPIVRGDEWCAEVEKRYPSPASTFTYGVQVDKN